MGEDVLSQSEIDKLLSALSTGAVSAEEVKADEEQKKVKTYDFKRPDKFSKDQIRTLYMLHENFARLLNTYLSTHLRTLVNIEVASVEQLTYQEFVQSLSNPSVIGVLAVPPLKGNAIMEINTGIAFAIIDRILGGKGENTIKPRVLTEIEEAIVRGIFGKAIANFQEAWTNVIHMDPSLEVIESNPQFTQIVPPSDMVVIVTLQTKIGDVEGLMNICLPYFTLESVMDKLNTKFWFSTMQDSSEDSYQDHMEDLIKHVQIPIKAVLGSSSISVSDFVNLQVGDIIRLDSKVAQEMDVYVGNIRKFKALPGATKEAYAVRVTSVIREEE